MNENLVRFFYFGFPLAAISIVFARPALFALNPEYEIATVVVTIMTIRTFLYVLSNIFQDAIHGAETIDASENPKFLDFVKSKLFVLPTIILIQYSLYVFILAIVLIFTKDNSTQLELVVNWAIVSLGVQIPFTIYFWKMAKNQFSLSIDTVTSIKYLFSTIFVFTFTYIIVEKFLVYHESIFDFLPHLVLYVGLGVLMYTLLTLLIDTKTRTLAKSILMEFTKNPKSSDKNDV